MSGSDAPAGIGRTALGLAMVRAAESRRRDRLFEDPYAAAFPAAAPGVFNQEQRGVAAWVSGVAAWGAAVRSHVVIRTRFFDDYLLDAAGRGIRQVVLVAAGLDTRAYRLPWPAGRRVFEVDLPEVLDFKRQVLDQRAAVPRCELRSVSADLRADWAAPLTAAGLRPDQPAAWLAEGLLIYLSQAEAAHLLTTIGELSAVGSRLAFESGDPGIDAIRAGARTLPAVAEYTELWQGGLPDPSGWLAQRGWRVEAHSGAAVTSRYGRAGAGPHAGGFLTATRA